MNPRKISSSSPSKQTNNSYTSSPPICSGRSHRSLAEKIDKAIAGKTCPICLDDNIDKGKAAVIENCMHVYCIECIQKWSKRNETCPICKSNFCFWFYKSGTSFKKHIVRQKYTSLDINSRIPTRRNALQYRRRVYDENLQAVPYQMVEYEQRVGDVINGDRERILERIVPWILRELEVITGIPDPSIIVHVATAVYFEALQKRSPQELLRSIAEEVEEDDSFLDPLRCFLSEKTNLFWHELKCFSQCNITMEAYDVVAEYTVPDDAAAAAAAAVL